MKTLGLGFLISLILCFCLYQFVAQGRLEVPAMTLIWLLVMGAVTGLLNLLNRKKEKK